MPVVTNNSKNKNNGADNSGNSSGSRAMAVPFIRATSEHLQPGNVDVTKTPTTSAQDLGVQDLPAYGYLRHLYILVEFSGGSGATTAAVANEDAPFNAISNIALTEPNGAFITQFNDGWQMYLSQKYGGLVPPYAADAKNSPVFSGVDTGGNFTFLLRLPISVSVRDGVGALANQDSAGQFKLRMTLASTNDIYDTAPDTLPTTARVRAWLASYDQPEPTTANMANQTQPPGVGTTSFWSVQSGISVSSGENTIEMKRKGNFLRQIIFVLRSSGSRSTAESNWPDETRFVRDAFTSMYLNEEVWKQIMFERTGLSGTIDTAGGLDNGVRFVDYAHEFDGGLGRENRDLWQPTLSSTRLEIAGNFGDSGTLDIITNDVAVASDVFM